MVMIIFLSAILLLISIILMILPMLTSAIPPSDRENLSPFECGFDPKNSSRMPFSLQFFLIAVIFLIFDVEIALLLPIPLILTSFSSIKTTTLVLIFIAILLLGLYYEWKNGALNWTI